MSCFVDLCRLCAGKIDSLLSFNIHMPEHSVLLKKILICLPIQVAEGDSYPNYICVDCAYKLDVMYEFRERCILTTQLFDEMMTDEVRSALELPGSVSHSHLDISSQSTPGDVKTIVVDLPGLDFGTDTPYLMEQNDPTDESQLLVDMTSDIMPLDDLKMDGNKLNVTFPSSVSSKESTKADDSQDENVKKSDEDNKKKRKCTECGIVCQSKYKLSQHMQKHRPEKPFICPDLNCSKSFRSKIGLAQHEAGHSGNFQLSCETCGKGFQCRSYLKVHQRVHSTEKNYSCQQCPQSFKSKQSLADHVNRHLGVKPYLCDICGRGFITKGLCKSHQKTHTGQDNRKFPCHICRKKFVSQSYLRIHFNIHSGIKPFMCEVCGKSFLTKVDLRVHNTMHTGEKSYVCETCGKAFARRDALRCHKRSHTGERPYKCDHCGQSFSQYSPMAIHKRLHTGERPYPCGDCTKAFVSRSTLTAHRKKHHGATEIDYRRGIHYHHDLCRMWTLSVSATDVQFFHSNKMLKIGFLGAGKMAQALAKGFIASGLTKGSLITASCAPQDVVCAEAFQSLGATSCFDNSTVVDKSDVLVLAVKPHIAKTVLQDIKPVITANHLLLSVAMGVTLNQMKESLPANTRIIRTMPNTPCLVGFGASVFAPGHAATQKDCSTTQNLLASVGTCEQVSESLLDVVTAVSGSGPAYVYVMIEALADGAVKMGMPRDLAYRLAAQTVIGAGKMVQITERHPGQLKDDVMSPAGSTAAGLHFLEKNHIRAALIGAVEEAKIRCSSESSNN